MARGGVTAGPTLIQTPAIRTALQRIQKDVDNQTRDARRLIGSESVAKLRAPSTSLVNVDTGLMRRSYKFKVAHGNNRIDIFNTATSKKGFRYPIYIEKQFRGVRRTLTTQRRSIVRNVNRRLGYGRVPSGKMQNEL